MRVTTLSIGFIALLNSCSSSTNKGEPPKAMDSLTQSLIFTVKGSEEKLLYQYPAVIEASETSTPGFTTGGRVDQVFVEEGQKVTQGQILAALAPTQSEAMLESANAALRKADEDFNRAQRLYSKGSCTEVELVNARTGLMLAKAAHKNAAFSLSETRCKAPFNGIIIEKKVSEGSVIAPGTVAFKMIKLDKPLVAFTVPQNDVNEFYLHQAMNVKIDAVPGNYAAKIVRKIPSADPASRSFTVKAQLDSDANYVLPGMNAVVSLSAADPITIVKLPVNIVFKDIKGQSYVIVSAGGKTEKRGISLGEISGDSVVVTKGLKIGDNLVISTSGDY